MFLPFPTLQRCQLFRNQLVSLVLRPQKFQPAQSHRPHRRKRQVQFQQVLFRQNYQLLGILPAGFLKSKTKAKLVRNVIDLQLCARTNVGVIFAVINVRNGKTVDFITPTHVVAANYFVRAMGDEIRVGGRLGESTCAQVQRIAVNGKLF